MLRNGTVLAEKWRIESYVGEGACAKVYAVAPVNAEPVGYDLVAKVIALPTGSATSKAFKEQQRLCNTLYFEYTLYVGLLASATLCPRRPPKFYGEDPHLGVRYLIMERMEEDLVSLAKNRALTHKQIADYGEQILNGLIWLHDKNFLFIDMKPDNFMLKNGKVFFVDFGLVERLGMNKGPSSGCIPGTPSYASLAVQRGENPSAKDELEALGYVLLSLYLRGNLPWAAASSLEETKRMKEAADIRRLCAASQCEELAELIHACREMDGRSRPDYDTIRRFLVDLRKKEGPSRNDEGNHPSARPKQATKKRQAPSQEVSERKAKPIKADLTSEVEVPAKGSEEKAAKKSPAKRSTREREVEGPFAFTSSPSHGYSLRARK